MNPRTASLWSDGRPQDPHHPRLEEDLEVDVVVIGAGITGTTAALRLAEAGDRVVVLEARRVCSGVTALTTAHATEAVDARYQDITRKFGPEGAELVATSSRYAIEHIARRASTLSIPCDLRRVPGYLFTEDPGHRDFLADEYAAARDAGLRVDLDPAIGLPFVVAGALRFADQLRFNALEYVWGLTRAAIAQGVRVYEGSRVVDLDDGEPVRVTLEHGPTVCAHAVICATHAPLNRVLIHGKLSHAQSYVAAFRDCPIEDALFWDTCDPYHYYRLATVRGESYLIAGGEDHETGVEEHTQIPFERLLAHCRARFGTDRPDYHWSAQVIEPIDGLPYVGRNSASRHVYVATGYAGNGMTFGTMAGLLCADLILGQTVAWAPLYDATRMKPSALGPFVDQNKSVAARLIAGRLEGPEVSSTHDIELDQGRLMKVGGERLAVYRDRGGLLHAVSAVCTHMGCVVRFNEAERTWDCPCHGSRFTVDGGVLDGPALSALAPKELDESEDERRPVISPDPHQPAH